MTTKELLRRAHEWAQEHNKELTECIIPYRYKSAYAFADTHTVMLMSRDNYQYWPMDWKAFNTAWKAETGATYPKTWRQLQDYETIWEQPAKEQGKKAFFAMIVKELKPIEELLHEWNKSEELRGHGELASFLAEMESNCKNAIEWAQPNI